MTGSNASDGPEFELRDGRYGTRLLRRGSLDERCIPYCREHAVRGLYLNHALGYVHGSLRLRSVAA